MSAQFEALGGPIKMLVGSRKQDDGALSARWGDGVASYVAA